MKSPCSHFAVSITLAAVTLLSTLSAAPDFKTLSGPANSLEEFSRQVTQGDVKWGGPEFAVEALVVRIPATGQLKEFPAEPTPEILASAAKFHVRLRPGLASGIEQLTMIDRTPAGVRVTNPQPVGMRFYAYALPLDSAKTNASGSAKIPAYDVRLMISYALLEGFSEQKGSVQINRHFTEASSQLRLTRGWLLMGGSARGRDEFTENESGTKRLQKMQHGFYFRIVDEHPAESAQNPMQAATPAGTAKTP